MHLIELATQAVFRLPALIFFLIKSILTSQKKVGYGANEFLSSLKVVEGNIVAFEKKEFDDSELTEIWVSAENGEEKLFILIDTLFSFRVGHKVRVVYSESLNIGLSIDAFKSENFVIKIENQQSGERCLPISVDEIYSMYSGFTAGIGYFMSIVFFVIFGFFFIMAFMSLIASLIEVYYTGIIITLLPSLLMGLFSWKFFVMRGNKAKVLAEIKIIEKNLDTY